MPKTLNIAVIGAGTMAQAVHLPVLRRRWDRFTIAALVDHSPRRRREASEVWGLEEDKRFETVTDLIAAVRAKTLTLDAAVLSTDGLHVEDLLALMRRGIPVLAEPPLGFSAEEVARVADFERMTGRRLVMMAYPQQYDDSVTRMAEQIAVKDLRMVDHEVLMPASQPLYGGAHVTTSSYDLPTEVRSQRRKDLQAAVVAGSGDGATQRDRDLYVKGLLTGVAHQLSVLEASYGPLARLSAVRHWPKGVIPGSLELLGELEDGARVRLVWHYLPFAPEYSESLQVLSARRRMRVELPAPSHGDRRSTVSLREKKSGVVQETATTAPKGAAELMWEAFHAFVDKGTPPVSGAAEARDQVVLMREVLAMIVAADGRSLEAEESEEGVEPERADGADGAAAESPGSEALPAMSVTAAAGTATETSTLESETAEPATVESATKEPGAAEVPAPESETDEPATAAPADAESATVEPGTAVPSAPELAAETLEHPVQEEEPDSAPDAESALVAESVPDTETDADIDAKTDTEPEPDADGAAPAPAPRTDPSRLEEEVTDAWGSSLETSDGVADGPETVEGPGADPSAGETPRP